MSRKWQRMVEKNKKQMNATRQKQGHSPLGGSDGETTVRGRSWVFPVALAAAGLAFWFSADGFEGETLNQVTVALYLLLAVFHYFVRRPFLKISKKHLSWRTYSGQRFVAAEDIAAIRIGEKQSTVELKDGKTKRSFSKWYHAYPMDRLNEALSQFAAQHHIPVHGDAKESYSKG